MFLLTPSGPAHSRAANTTMRTTVSPLTRPCRTGLQSSIVAQFTPQETEAGGGDGWAGGGDLGA